MGFLTKAGDWVDRKEAAVVKTVKHLADDLKGPAPDKPNSSLAKSKDVSCRVRASHKTDEEIINKCLSSEQKLGKRVGGMVGAKASVVVRPHHKDSWGTVYSEGKGTVRAGMRNRIYRNAAEQRGLQVPDRAFEDTYGDILQGAGEGFVKGAFKPIRASSDPQPDLSQLHQPVSMIRLHHNTS
jgi:hypothetical protein